MLLSECKRCPFFRAQTDFTPELLIDCTAGYVCYVCVNYLLQICGYLPLGKRRLVLQESVTLTQHIRNYRSKKRELQVRALPFQETFKQ